MRTKIYFVIEEQEGAPVRTGYGAEGHYASLQDHLDYIHKAWEGHTVKLLKAEQDTGNGWQLMYETE